MDRQSIKIFIAGDVVPRNKTVELYKKAKVNSLFEDYKEILESSDINIVNFEAPIINGAITPIKKSGPNLFTSKTTLKTLKDAGFNCITLANNHFRDQGNQGVIDTINAAKEMQMDFVGGGENINDAKQIKYIKTKEKVITLINVCESEYSIATNDYGGSNPIDIISLYNDINEAKTKSDYIIVISHGGTELYNLPTPRMKRLFRHIIDLGADVVINHHQHCFSGYEVYKGKTIFYGLGNFNFDSNKKVNECWFYGYSVILNIGKEVKFDIVPHEQCKEDGQTRILKDQAEFWTTIGHLNNIIADDDELQSKFNDMAIMKAKGYLTNFEPYNSRIPNKLFRMGLLPKTFNKNKLLILLNYLRCESHNDVLKEILDYKINKQ
ncbi:MAG: CapA family protein [Bacteroidaceae bacterium]|nr:CapA family protein [Bacteroidaceae bacterium]